MLLRRKDSLVVEDMGEFERVMVRDAADAVQGASLPARVRAQNATQKGEPRSYR